MANSILNTEVVKCGLVKEQHEWEFHPDFLTQRPQRLLHTFCEKNFQSELHIMGISSCKFTQPVNLSFGRSFVSVRTDLQVEDHLNKIRGHVVCVRSHLHPHLH